MKIQTSKTDERATLRLSGRFQFDSHRAFRSAYEVFLADAGVKVIVLDFSDVDYLDSSALGMLLLLREHVGGDDSDIRVVNSSPDVRKILGISNFDKLFDIN